jgi:multidrug efflux pump subunit AcrA (membrane-fusion protein)
MNSNPISPSQGENAHAAGSGPSHRAHHVWLYLLIAILMVGAALYLGWLPRQKQNQQVQARAMQQRNALPIVQVVTARQSSSTEEVTLPGTVVPVFTTHIYARAAGYVKALNVDIGDTVHRGQLLAVIDSPDLDATVMQQRSLVEVSKDAINTAHSQHALQQATYDRVHTLVLHGVLSQQDDDIASAAVNSAADAVRSAENSLNAANSSLAHWVALASYEQVRSPIDGTVTARNIEVGSLVSPSGAGEGLTATPGGTFSQSGGPPTGGAQGGELFQIANVHDLRVFVSVPEENAMSLRPGQQATVTFSELPTEQFRGKIIRSSNSLDPQTRTLLLEVRITDPRHRLRPGMFASVQLHFNSPDPGILVSGDSVIPRAQGQFVAVVENNVVQLRSVHVGRDLGTQVYVTRGLKNGDQVIVNPTDVVQEGVHVRAEPAPKGQEK